MSKDSYVDENFSFSSDDDDAPAEVNTSSTRKKKLSQIQDIRLQDKKTKHQEKEKRRRKNELFKSQKEEKLLNFGKRALPADVLEAVSAKNTKLDESDEEVNEEKDEDDGDSSNDEDRLSGGDMGENIDDALHNKDFISLDSSVQKKGLNVVTVEAPKKNKTSLENALAFRNNRLFHKHGVAPVRQSAKQRRDRLLRKKQLRVK